MGIFTHCTECETDSFCQDVKRCMKSMARIVADEAEVDGEIDELTSDSLQGLKKNPVFSTQDKLSDEVIDILKEAIK